MTIFRCDLAAALIDDLIWEQDPWWNSELETLTGCTREEYRALRGRLTRMDYVPDRMDRKMLHQAANNLLGYPGLPYTHVSAISGERWKEEVVGFLERMVE